MKLEFFKQKDNLFNALENLFKGLNIPVNIIDEKSIAPVEILTKTYKDNNEAFQIMEDVIAFGMVDDAAFSGNAAESLDNVKKNKKDYDGILLFGVTLKKRSNGLLPTRTQLAEITRAFNREYHYTPVVVVFRYADYISIANAERITYKQEWREGEKAGKVSLLRDIEVKTPHTGHLKILQELKITRSGRNGVNNFKELYKYWQEVFSVSILNKQFYKELSDWYFWAMREVYFPDAPFQANFGADGLLDPEVREHNAKNLIRLLTRILFVWFIKEKKLIPEELFDEKYIKTELLKNFEPQKNTSHNYKTQGSMYYRAILQNLFFATLNQDMGKREFRKDGQNRNVTNLMRYKRYFKNPDAFIELVEDVVPFMNGGLFECLDKPMEGVKGKRGGEVIKYIDGFSDREENPLLVPDYVFFGTEDHINLSDEYGQGKSKNKDVSVKGLIDILQSYKFTIAENTPIVQDIALDPELLGRVFENLLASYNPETKKNARKQTGSFYTPREIVNYMVDESLLAHLKNRLNNLVKDDKKLDEKLHQLLSYDDIQPFEDEKTKEAILKAIDECKILDPACGSGAFPMGALQKMVHIIHKLDPKNERWKERQIEKAHAIDDSNIRDSLIDDIEEAFENNELDFGRKLYLIENCIYGVDIQPIAVQISKLRFFISLIVEQKVNKRKKNHGVRPLPNLETKFVAANTLIGLDKPEAQGNLFDSQDVKYLENKLKDVRHRLFSAKTPKTKRKLREEDKELREQIAQKLEESGLGNETARQLADWDPYDQNASSPFFDPEWMFDIAEGFDVVIGNPPWGAKISKEDKLLFKEKYPKIDSSTPNSFAYFLGEALYHSSGIISYVLPDSILIKDFSKTRRWAKNGLFEISWYLNTGIPEEYKPFVYVEHDVCVLFINQKKNVEKCRIKKYLYDFKEKRQIIKDHMLRKDEFIYPEHEFTYNLKIENVEITQYSYLKELPVLESILQCHEGIHTGNSRDILFHKKVGEGNYKPLFYGGRAGDNISNYMSETSGWYVDYRKEIINKKNGLYASLRDERIFKYPKIYVTRTGNPIKAFYDVNTYASNNFFSVQFKDYSNNKPENLKRILPLILSKFANYYIRTFAAPRLGNTFIETKIYHLLKIPYVSELIEYMPLNELCSSIIHCMKVGYDYKLLQQVSDSIILNIYFPEHMKERGIDVLQYVEQDINEVMQGKDFENLSDEQKESVINQLHKRWTDPKNEVVKRMARFKEKSPDILKPILES
jgi:hypothetical protein